MKEEKSSSQQFIELYNQLDDYMRKELRVEGYVDHSTLLRQMSEKNRVFLASYKDLKMFADLRNLIVHNPYGKNADPLIVPHAFILHRYQEIVNQVLNPQKALSIAIKREYIYTAKPTDSAIKVMKAMNDKTYTHVPILEDDKMIGVFSENTLLSYQVHHKESLIMEDTPISEFSEFIPLDKHPSEYFEFIGRNALVVDVEDLFRKGLKEGKRIAVVFITESGRQEEKLLGLLTAWDIAGKEV